MVNVDKIRELCAEKGMSLSFLCRKIGVTASYFSDVERKNLNVTPTRVEMVAELLGTTSEYLMDKTDVKERRGGVKIKVYGTIAAGIPIDAVEDIIDEEEIPAAMARDGEYIGLKVKGDSMYPLIQDGSTAIIRKQPDCESGDIAAVYVNGDEATLKRVIKRTNGITLVPENPNYKPMSFTGTDAVTILGVLKEVRIKF